MDDSDVTRKISKPKVIVQVKNSLGTWVDDGGVSGIIAQARAALQGTVRGSDKGSSIYRQALRT
jgi:hypothetical protein